MIATSRRGTRISRFLAVAFPPLLADCTSAHSGPDGIRAGVRRDPIYPPVAPPAPTGKSPAPPRATRNSIVATLLLLAVGVSGCSSADFSVQDVNLRARGDTLYLLARSGNVSRNLCASLGGDVARAEGRSAAVEGRTIHRDQVLGCYTVRHIIVCPEEDAACVAHEERHRLEGAFHR